jgi:uncharacterized protein (TIGR02246 family)
MRPIAEFIGRAVQQVWLFWLAPLISTAIAGFVYTGVLEGDREERPSPDGRRIDFPSRHILVSNLQQRLRYDDRRGRMRRLLLPLAAALPICAPLTSNAEEDVDRTAIDEANARLIALQKQGDAEGMGDMYTDDAILLPSGAERADGRKAIQAFWAKSLGAGVEDVQLKTETLEPLGKDLVYEIGSYKTTPKGAEPVTGYYLVLWKRVEGEWKLHVDIFNEKARK